MAPSLFILRLTDIVENHKCAIVFAIEFEDLSLGLPITQAAWIRDTMPSILRIHGLRVVIYFNDHSPAHVHVLGKGCEAIFQLNCPGGPPSLRENFNFSKKDLERIEISLVFHLTQLCMQWEFIHGDI